MSSHNEKNTKIVFFDGDCGLCQGMVSKLLFLDKKKQLKFAPLKGKTAKAYLTHQDLSCPTVVYVCAGTLFKKSDAVLRILIDLKGLYLVFNLFFLIPRWLRDFLYDLLAKHRYRFFKSGCDLYKPTQNTPFLP